MKTKILFLAASLLALQFVCAQAQSFNIESYKLTVSGTSSLHDWESAVEKVDCTGSFKLTNNELTDISNVVVKIPVKAIKSTKGKMMDNKTWEAFGPEKNPFITFVMRGRIIEPSKATLQVFGDLTMAGVTQRVDFDLTYKILPDGDLQLTGSKKIDMTDFRMDTPTAMMGTIKVGPEVTINVNLIINEAQTL